MVHFIPQWFGSAHPAATRLIETRATGSPRNCLEISEIMACSSINKSIPAARVGKARSRGPLDSLAVLVTFTEAVQRDILWQIGADLGQWQRSLRAVADKFDPYREALVMETNTIWPSEYDELPATEKAALEEKLHASPANCGQLEYVRTHTGFCRQITVTSGDVQRLSG
jgi:hypothetical protein